MHTCEVYLKDMFQDDNSVESLITSSFGKFPMLIYAWKLEQPFEIHSLNFSQTTRNTRFFRLRSIKSDIKFKCPNSSSSERLQISNRLNHFQVSKHVKNFNKDNRIIPYLPNLDRPYRYTQNQSSCDVARCTVHNITESPAPHDFFARDSSYNASSVSDERNFAQQRSIAEFRQRVARRVTLTSKENNNANRS